MSYGIKIYNSYNSLVISEAYSNYHLAASGVWARNSVLPTINDGEMYFVRPVILGDTIYTGVDNYGRALASSVRGDIMWVLLKRDGAVSGSDTIGFRVFRDSGAVAFDSNKRHLIPSLVARSTGATTITHPSAPAYERKRYINLSSLRIVGIAESGLGHFDYFIGVHAKWDSDVSTRISIDICGIAPGGTSFPNWGGTLIYSFIDI